MIQASIKVIMKFSKQFETVQNKCQKICLLIYIFR